jgi:hypothetical protein
LEKSQENVFPAGVGLPSGNFTIVLENHHVQYIHVVKQFTPFSQFSFLATTSRQPEKTSCEARMKLGL